MDSANLNFLKEVLMTDHKYWIVESTQCLHYYIMLVTFPVAINRGMKYHSVTLKDIEDLNEQYFENTLCLNKNIGLFINYESINNVVRGFPIKGCIYEFLKKALEIDSNKIRDYINLL